MLSSPNRAILFARAISLGTVIRNVKSQINIILFQTERGIYNGLVRVRRHGNSRFLFRGIQMALI